MDETVDGGFLDEPGAPDRKCGVRTTAAHCFSASTSLIPYPSRSFLSNALIHCGGANSVGHSLIVVFDRPQQVRDNAVVDDVRCIMCRSSDGPVIPLSSCPQ